MLKNTLLGCLLIMGMLTANIGCCAVAPGPAMVIVNDIALEEVLYKQLLVRNTDLRFSWASDEASIVDSDWLADVFEKVYERDRATSDDFDYLLHNIKDYELVRSGSAGAAIFNLRVSYFESAEQLVAVNKLVGKSLKALKMDNDSLPIKVRKIHDFIIRKVKYDGGTSKDSAYAAIVDRQSNSRGYALLAYKMFTEANVPCRIVWGTVAGNTAFWNMVQLDGRWYYVDLARDDGNSEVVPVRYNYFLRGSAAMAKDHSLAEDYHMAEFEANYIVDSKDYQQRDKLILQADAAVIRDKAGVGSFNELYAQISDKTVDPFEQFNDALSNSVLDALQGVFEGI